MAELRGTGGTILRSSFDETKEESLRAALASAQAAQSYPRSHDSSDALVRLIARFGAAALEIAVTAIRAKSA
jgi:hypothetical protein